MFFVVRSNGSFNFPLWWIKYVVIVIVITLNNFCRPLFLCRQETLACQQPRAGQTVWASFSESRPPLRPSVYVDSDVEGFDQNCLRQGRRQTDTETGVTTRAWREGLKKPRQIYHFSAVVDEDEDENDVHFGLRLLDRAGPQTMLTVINIPVLTGSGNCSSYMGLAVVQLGVPCRLHVAGGGTAGRL